MGEEACHPPPLAPSTKLQIPLENFVRYNFKNYNRSLPPSERTTFTHFCNILVFCIILKVPFGDTDDLDVV
jgi:hypothetical protein